MKYYKFNTKIGLFEKNVKVFIKTNKAEKAITLSYSDKQWIINFVKTKELTHVVQRCLYLGPFLQEDLIQRIQYPAQNRWLQATISSKTVSCTSFPNACLTFCCWTIALQTGVEACGMCVFLGNSVVAHEQHWQLWLIQQNFAANNNIRSRVVKGLNL